MKHGLIVIVFILSSSNSYPNILNVPKDFTSIQEAIDAAANGDTVLVEPGTYVENINFIGKAITVKSSGGPGVTVIDGGNPRDPNFASVVMFISNEGQDSTIEGFTLTNGSGTLHVFPSGQTNYCGGGVYCNYSSPTIIGNIITNNSTYNFGGGIYGFYSSPRIKNNTITNNSIIRTSNGGGGGVSCVNSSAIIEKNIIKNNMVISSSHSRGGGIHWTSHNATIVGNIIANNYVYGEIWGHGGGIYSLGSLNDIISNNKIIRNSVHGGTWGHGGGMNTSSVTTDVTNNTITENSVYGGTWASGGGMYSTSETTKVTNNTITENSVSGSGSWVRGGGIYCDQLTDHTIITNSILWSNSAQLGSEIYGNPIVNYCDIMGGYPGYGNINASPLFADSAKFDYHLTYNSPCRNTGNNTTVTEPYDFEGDPRIAWNGTVDMGADEFHTHLYFTGEASPSSGIDVNIIGLPEQEVLLFKGDSILDPPTSTVYGEWFLASPVDFIISGQIPQNGRLTFQFR